MRSNKWQYCGGNNENYGFPGDCSPTSTQASDLGPTSTLGTHDQGVEYYIYTQAFETDISLKISDDGHTSFSSGPVTAKVAILEENNVPSMPKLICPKGKSSYVGCFQTNSEFSLPR